jgi:23S rRNA pseudouridine1911/1915/1917 synthase
MIVHVPTTESSVRLDAFIASLLPKLSRSQVRWAIVHTITVEGKLGKKGRLLHGGEKIEFPEALLTPCLTPNLQLALRILYEDEEIVAIDKPSGIASHPIHGWETMTAANFLAAHDPRSTEVGKLLEAGLAHRLDTQTSGVLLAAKTREALASLREQFSSERVVKEYVALCTGKVERDQTICSQLAHRRTSRRKIVVAHPGVRGLGKKWDARTEVRVLQVYPAHTLISVIMKTGVMHQIRAHLASIGHPIEGETLYAGSPAETASLRLNRHFLHASSITFFQPRSGSVVRIESALPDELKEVLSNLDRTLQRR